MLKNRSVRVLLINVFGGGIMRCDTISDALLMVNQQEKIEVPIVIRLSGTNAELAQRRIRESLPGADVFDGLYDAAMCALNK